MDDIFEYSPIKFIEYKLGMSGSFYKALFNAFIRADASNSQKLLTAFPELVHAKYYSTLENYEELLLEWAANNKVYSVKYLQKELFF